MRRLTGLLVGLLSISPVSPALRAQEAVVPERQIIEGANQQLERWYRAGQIDSVVTHFSEQAWQMPDGVPPLVGRAAIRQFWSQAAGWGEWTFSIKTQDVLVSGNLAAERGTYILRYAPGKTAPKEMSAPTEDRGNYVVVWRKEADGRWRILWDAPSSVVPPRTPAT